MPANWGRCWGSGRRCIEGTAGTARGIATGRSRSLRNPAAGSSTTCATSWISSSGAQSRWMLAIGAGFAPDHAVGGVIDRLLVAVHALAVAFHGQLLQIGGKAAQAGVVGQDGVRAGVGEIGVPDV